MSSQCNGIVCCVKFVGEDGTVRCRLSSDDSASGIALAMQTVKSLVKEFNKPA